MKAVKKAFTIVSVYERAGHMGKDKHMKESLRTPSQRRRGLSDITNLSLSPSWEANSRDDVLVVKNSSTGNDLQLREANAVMKRLLLEKEGALETQAGKLDQMKRKFMLQLRRQSQVNEEIICYNSRLSKEVGQLRDQLKLLHHEYCLLTVARKTKEAEIQLKLAESQEQLMRLFQLSQAMKSKKQASTQDQPVPTISKKSRSGIHRRHSTSGNLVIDVDWNSSTKLENGGLKESVCKSNIFRSTLPTLASSYSTVTSKPSPNAETSAYNWQQRANRCSGLLGLEPMIEVCEDDSPRKSISESCYPVKGSSRCGVCARCLTSSHTSNIRTDDKTCAAQKLSTKMKSSKGSKESFVPLGHHEEAFVSSSTTASHFSRSTYNNLTSGSGRPVRKSAENVVSYREPPLNTKMRRPG